MNSLRMYSLLKIWCLFALLWPGCVLAKQAQVLLYPTRVVLERGERTATFGIKNTGDASGGYRVMLVDMHMKEDGSVVQLGAEETEPFSAKKFIRISPRSITLQPGQDQNIRIMVRAPQGLEDGEYRTHIKVMLVENNLDGIEDGEEEAAPKKDVSVVIKPRLCLIVPLIIRYGTTRYTTTILNASLHYVNNAKGVPAPYADIVLGRSGNRSSMGDITIDYTDNAGKTTLLKHVAGLPVYRPTEKRKVSLPLDVPPGVKLGKGMLHVTYRAQAAEGGGLLAEGSFPL